TDKLSWEGILEGSIRKRGHSQESCKRRLIDSSSLKTESRDGAVSQKHQIFSLLPCELRPHAQRFEFEGARAWPKTDMDNETLLKPYASVKACFRNRYDGRLIFAAASPRDISMLTLSL
ncbi:hypothetical protein HN011_012068, partial [Eciton burchellii]